MTCARAVNRLHFRLWCVANRRIVQLKNIEASMEKPQSKKRKIQGSGRHQKEWESLQGEYAGWIKSSTKGPEFSFCVPCKKDVKVAASGFYDMKSHFKTAGHVENVAKSKSHVPLTQHFASSTNPTSSHKATSAEILFCHFLAEHNIPFTAADHFSDLVKSMFPDSPTAKVSSYYYHSHVLTTW